ncbi:unnamed protein product [Mytilus edulis]|uniref:Uncharacterized protein n=1 Tax=Mytilus edulis TaxID=6550 RepID=A0A8S3QBV4_MYTED|nr:unnamed protein product [Mytilus edulis]
MAESPDLEIRFRSEEREKEARHERNTEFADANETLEEHRANVYAHGEGDVNREYGMSGQRGQRGINTDGFRYNNPHTVSIRPEPYDGGEDWEEYISHFEVCAELGRWRDADKVLALAAALRGPARTFYISLEQTEKRDYGILTQRLGLRFGSTRQQNRWLSRLEMRKRNPGEAIAALADDLRQMAQRAYIDLDARAQEVLALNQLYKSVTPEVKYQCTNQACRTVAGAVEVIERYEAIIGDGSEKKKGSVRMTTDTHLGEASNFSQEPSENQFHDSINGLTRRISQLEGTKQNYSNSWQNNNNRRPQWGNTNNRQAKCFICESTSHLCRYCPFYLRYKQENARHDNTGGQQGSKDQDNRNSQSINQGNFSSQLAQPITVHAKEQIGVCESYFRNASGRVCNYIGTEGTSSDKLQSHIEDLFNRSSVHLQEKEKQHLKELLQAYSDVFAKSADDLGRTNRVQHRINTGTAHPIRQAPRRLPLGKREIEKKEIVKMLN